MLGNFFQLLAAVEHEHAHASLVGGLNGRHFFDRVAKGNGFGVGPCLQAEGDLLPRCRVKAGAKPDQTGQDGHGRVGLDGIVNARERQGFAQCAVTGFHLIDINDKAGRCRLLLGKKTGDFGIHIPTPPSSGSPACTAEKDVAKRSNGPAKGRPTKESRLARTLDVVA